MSNNYFENHDYPTVELCSHTSNSWIDYTKYVLVDRALPDSVDGLKPVHRRILFAQQVMGNNSNKAYKKSARIVGDVLGKYHPHGDGAVYNSLVRMAQPWVMSAPLADGQGNWGNQDRDNAAAMRYTEVRMTSYAEGMFTDLSKDTAVWEENYDATEVAPTQLPTRHPNLIVNGSEGIAVGMACSLPPHHPIEALNVVKHLTEKRISGEDVELAELKKIMPAPDVPTGGIVHDLEDMETAWLEGTGHVRVRSVWHEELVNSRKAIVITAIPYGITPKSVILQIEEAKKGSDKRPAYLSEEIAQFRDETNDEHGLRIVIELSSGAEPEIVFNKLCSITGTKLDAAIHYNVNVVHNKRPEKMGLLSLFNIFIDSREKVIRIRTQKELEKAQGRLHILAGFEKAFTDIDGLIATIRANKTKAEANVAIQEQFGIDEVQANAVLEISLTKLTSGELGAIIEEANQLRLKVEGFEKILGDMSVLREVILSESDEQIQKLLTAKDDNGKNLYVGRRSDFSYDKIILSPEDLAKEEFCSIFMSQKGFIRIVPNTFMKAQRRGTVGNKHMELRKGDILDKSIDCFSHDYIAFMTTKGRVGFCRAFELSTLEKGQHVNNFIKLGEDEEVTQIAAISKETIHCAGSYVLTTATKMGIIKQTTLDSFNPNVKRTVRAINLSEDDQVAFFGVATESATILLSASNNKTVKFKLDSIRETSRTSRGVKAMNIDKEEGVVVLSGIVVESIDEDDMLMGCVSTDGIMKLSSISSYRETARGTKGVTTMKLKEGASILAAFAVPESEKDIYDVITMSSKSMANRVSLEHFSAQNRATMGMRLVEVANKDTLISATLVRKEEE